MVFDTARKSKYMLQAHSVLLDMYRKTITEYRKTRGGNKQMTFYGLTNAILSPYIFCTLCYKHTSLFAPNRGKGEREGKWRIYA